MYLPFNLKSKQDLINKVNENTYICNKLLIDETKEIRICCELNSCNQQNRRQCYLIQLIISIYTYECLYESKIKANTKMFYQVQNKTKKKAFSCKNDRSIVVGICCICCNRVIANI